MDLGSQLRGTEFDIHFVSLCASSVVDWCHFAYHCASVGRDTSPTVGSHSSIYQRAQGRDTEAENVVCSQGGFMSFKFPNGKIRAAPTVLGYMCVILMISTIHFEPFR